MRSVSCGLSVAPLNAALLGRRVAQAGRPRQVVALQGRKTIGFGFGLRLNGGTIFTVTITSMNRRTALTLVVAALAVVTARASEPVRTFDFHPAHSGFVSPETPFTVERGFGFDLGSTAGLGNGCVTGARPFFFSVAAPEGNHEVRITFGDAKSATTNTVKAEMRRLMLERIVTRSGEFVTRTITVNTRTPEFAVVGQASSLSGGSEGRGAAQASEATRSAESISQQTGGTPVPLKPDHMKLKQREKDSEMINWDEKLTLEFNGSRPGIAALEISPARVPTVFLLGDSTVCDQPNEPWNSWGQMLPRFFKSGIAIANHAQSGESIKSSLGAKRFDKVFSEMKPGDWLFVQFGHNDMKDKATNALETYRVNLKKIAAQTRAKGGTLVLVTSMERKAGIERDTLAGYPQTVRDVAKEEGVALIDLHPMSRVLYKALGSDLDKAFQDGTHHNNYGSYELAKCVAEGVRQNKLPLAKYLADDFAGFDPATPDSVTEFAVPESPTRSEKKPDGN